MSAIEAPTGLWEDSIIPDGSIRNDLPSQVSPMKMVGLLRPSTIIEETWSQSVTSSLGAVTVNLDSSSSSEYKTAQEGSNSSYCSDQIAIKKNGAGNIDEQNEMEENPEETIIEIDSDEDENTVLDDGATKDIPKKLPALRINEEREIEDNDCDKENNFFHESFVASAALEESLKFNDTLEEMDYLLQKGMEYMANPANIGDTFPLQQTPAKVLRETNKTSSIPVYQSTKIRTTPLTSSKPATNKGKVKLDFVNCITNLINLLFQVVVR